MVHLYWDFKGVPELKAQHPKKKIELIERLREELKIPVGYTAGFDNPYIEIESDDPAMKHPFFESDMIPRPQYITLIAVRHLTYQKPEFVEKIQSIATQVFS